MVATSRRSIQTTRKFVSYRRVALHRCHYSLSSQLHAHKFSYGLSKSSIITHKANGAFFQYDFERSKEHATEYARIAKRALQIYLPNTLITLMYANL